MNYMLKQKPRCKLISVLPLLCRTGLFHTCQKNVRPPVRPILLERNPYSRRHKIKLPSRQRCPILPSMAMTMPINMTTMPILKCSYHTSGKKGISHTEYCLSKSFQEKIASGPQLNSFSEGTAKDISRSDLLQEEYRLTSPSINTDDIQALNRKVYFEIYGCQMNVSDAEIAWSILQKHGFERTTDITESDVILLVTCSIRERAEEKIWNRLKYLGYLKKRRHHEGSSKPSLKVGILGCMAERLKKQILEKEDNVDVICGPDAYRDLPHLLAETEAGVPAVNVLLSMEETYADVVPVRLDSTSSSAYVSIMRGCDNMCTYCIVPFTRGRERSRPISSIVDEIRKLSDQGVRVVTLLGQNVNSYRDTSEMKTQVDACIPFDKPTTMVQGFKTVYKPKLGGRRFADLLDSVSLVDPNMRIRFTSPHPKDFPDEVLYLIAERDNLCKHLHLPAQSGSTAVLERMRRGYSRQAYLDLVAHIRDLLPDVTLTSDFIAGFCGETEEEHLATLSLLRLVKYNFAFCFPYSMRQKTPAHRRLVDDVAQDVKHRRHMELVSAFREEALQLNQTQIGREHLVLIEGYSKKSGTDVVGRNDGNVKVIVPDVAVAGCDGTSTRLTPGTYVAVKITGASSQTLKAMPLYQTTIRDFYSIHHRR